MLLTPCLALSAHSILNGSSLASPFYFCIYPCEPSLPLLFSTQGQQALESGTRCILETCLLQQSVLELT